MAEPSLLLMDEPTTGLDVTVEAAVLDLVAALREQAQLRDRLHQPQSRHRGADLRPHRRHVCRRAGGGGPDRRGLPRSPPSLYPRPAELRFRCSAADKHSRPLAADPGPGAADPGAAEGLRLRPALRLCRTGRCTTEPIPTDLYGETGLHRVQCIRVRELPGHARPIAANGNHRM